MSGGADRVAGDRLASEPPGDTDPASSSQTQALTDLASRLERLEQLLRDGGEPSWEQSMGLRRTELAGATSVADLQEALRRLLGVYGGMGSFSDVVLQDREGVRAEQQELHRVRTEVYDLARSLLA